jgi:exosortase
LELTAHQPYRRIADNLGLSENWLVILAFALLALPTAVSLGNLTWASESGAQGPLILCTGAWLLWRIMPELREYASPGNVAVTFALVLISVGSYVFGRAYDFLTVETAGVYGIGMAILYSRYGLKVISRNWFPFFYLAFVIPPPGSELVKLTAPLKQFVSQVSTQWLAACGVPVAHLGVTIFVAQYQLLVEDACSGMNSIIGIFAITLLYIYLSRGSSWRYSVILVSFAIPIAIAANILRIMTLILLTYNFGDRVAQGFLHYTTGFFLFALSLILVFGLDRLFSAVADRFGWIA